MLAVRLRLGDSMKSIVFPSESTVRYKHANLPATRTPDPLRAGEQPIDVFRPLTIDQLLRGFSVSRVTFRQRPATGGTHRNPVGWFSYRAWRDCHRGSGCSPERRYGRDYWGKSPR